MDAINFKYIFSIDNQEQFEIQISIDGETLNFVEQANEENPEWTELQYCQCINCPLNKEDVKYCPVAKNISSAITKFKDGLSCEATHVTVVTEERTYSKRTDLQQGLNSLFGLIMASSECPHFQWLKPLARFHLPFASFEETTFRAISSCALSEMLRHKSVNNIDDVLKLIEYRYEQLQIINAAMLERIQGIGRGEADRNAIVRFHTYCQLFNFSLKDRSFDDTISNLFKHLTDTPIAYS